MTILAVRHMIGFVHGIGALRDDNQGDLNCSAREAHHHGTSQAHPLRVRIFLASPGDVAVARALAPVRLALKQAPDFIEDHGHDSHCGDITDAEKHALIESMKTY